MHVAHHGPDVAGGVLLAALSLALEWMQVVVGGGGDARKEANNDTDIIPKKM